MGMTVSASLFLDVCARNVAAGMSLGRERIA